jgi:hypothetical protein
MEWLVAVLATGFGVSRVASFEVCGALIPGEGGGMLPNVGWARHRRSCSRVVSGLPRDLTARTTLVASHYQSTHDARRSCEDHAQIVSALAAGDPRERLRASLAPLVRAGTR